MPKASIRKSVMRAFGRAGAFARAPAAHDGGDVDLVTAIRAMAAAGEHCLSTSFCMWCQDALGWYIFASGNDELKAKLGQRVATGDGARRHRAVEPDEDVLRDRADPAEGEARRRRLSGARRCCRSSRISASDHYFGAVFEVEDEPKHYVMAVVPCAHEGVTLARQHQVRRARRHAHLRRPDPRRH